MELTISPFENGGFAHIGHIELRNFGQTPAYDLTVTSQSKIDVPSALPFHEPEKPTPLPSAGIAFPHAGLHINVGGPLSNEELEAIRKREKTFFLWGTVRYKDAFSQERHLKFRMVSLERVIGGGEVYKIGPHALGYDAD